MCSPARNKKATYTAFGHSLISNPWGKIDKELDEKSGILFYDIEISYLEKVRRELPLLVHRREELY